MESGSGYLRLCPGQTVGLRYAGLVLELEDVVKKGRIVTELEEVGSTSRHSSTRQSEVIPVSKKIKKPEKLKRKVFMVTEEELELASSILHSSCRLFNFL